MNGVQTHPLRPLFYLAAGLLCIQPATVKAGGGEPTILAWNNLGMHCMDDDYSVFTILPPFNTLDAQLIDASGNLVTTTTGITVTYEAVADPDGSINSTSIGKSNFWEFSESAYGVILADELGLAGTRMPGLANTPQSMTWNGGLNWFEGEGIPITPFDDAMRLNPYPLLRVVARDAGGALLAETSIVAPVSGEMDCRACHASGAGPAAMPSAGWVNHPDDKRDFRLNILLLHDEAEGGKTAFQDALAANGWPASGLYDAVEQDGTPILCAKCHLSEALPGSGIAGIPPLTQAIHSQHATVVNPANGMTLDNVANRSGCYTCHPGSETRCLRGAMGSAVAADGSMAMQCQDCHGSMSQVGSDTRTGWFDEPTCQQCHTGSATNNNGQIRYTSVFEPDGTPRVAVNDLFATNPETPVPGVSLYRFSSGHGGLQCSACHGSTHAEFPASHRNDNLQSVAVQGHVGVIADCTACHASMPVTVRDGPHGMHPVGSAWISSHDEYGKNPDCLSCHGADYRSTVLSRVFADRTLTVSDDGQTRTFELWRGQNLSCFMCHKQEDDGRLGGLFTNNHAPVVPNFLLQTPAETPGGVVFSSTDADGNPRTYRIVNQPQHGAVSLDGATATYFPWPGYAGPDAFTFAANDGFTDSNLGVVSVNVGDTGEDRDSDFDGLSDFFEYALGLSADFPTVYSVPMLETADGQRYLTMRLPLGITPVDALVEVEVSPDLENWFPATVLSQGDGELVARDPVAVGSGTSRFIRARVLRL
jgi:hypothetical protein